MTTQLDTVPALLAGGADTAAAIGAPGRFPLSYADLRKLARQTGELLNSIGIGRNDRIAIVLPNGPEMAVAFLCVACVATTAPLNPSYRTEEFDFYLGDLGARALILQAGDQSPARQIAETRGIPIIELVPGPGPAGNFHLVPPAGLSWAPSVPHAVTPDDIALVLHTSGTTARPKIVPLRQINITASAHNIGRTLQLGPEDICLNIMPLFHIHGLIAATLSSIAAGGSVVCAPGLNGFRFFSWFREAQPTWYTAVPTMHQTLLELAPRFQEVIAGGRLRFLRSSSASLPPQVMTQLEKTFQVPVIEAYGMTEASHQMTSNPLPPGSRYPGSVGIAAGPEIAIMNDEGQLMPSGKQGEVVIRGRNVVAGYENNPEANAKSFINGWFRTGDEGVLDTTGYLRLTGRLKEIINRAGEKISPLEIDNVLMGHPAVQQVVTFAVPSKLFGEDVAAAVVLRDGANVDPENLREFVAKRLAAFKIPQKIIFLNEIPKGATGKLQRIGLAERLGVAL